MQSQTVATTEFTVSAASYAREAAERLTSRYWWLPTIALIIMTVYGAVADWRWLIVCAAFVFIALPTVLMFAWIRLLGRPGVCEAAFPTTVTLDTSTSRLNITYSPLPTPPSDTEDSEPESPETTDASPIIENDVRCPRPFTCSVSDITSCLEWNKFLRITFHPGNRVEMVLVPVSAFQTTDDAVSFFTYLNEKISGTAVPRI